MKDRPAIDDLASRLGQRASTYFDALADESVTVRPVGQSKRLFSSLFEFEISTSDRRHRQSVMIKQIHSADELNGRLRTTDRAAGIQHLLPKPDPIGREGHALKTIDAHFSALGDPRFASIRVLDVWLDGALIVMEKSPDPPLNRLLRTAALSRRYDAVQTALRNAGAWLREFHGIFSADSSATYGQSQWEDEITRLGECLADDCLFQNIRHETQTQLMYSAELALSRSLPVVTAHDDFAPRNLFVGAAGRVCVIDTLADTMKPVYADLAHFLFDLKTGKLQRLSFGLAFSRRCLRSLERELLAGYFGDDPYSIDLVRMFEARALLIRWAALHVAESESSAKASLQRNWTRRCYARQLQRLCRDLNQSVDSITQHLNRGGARYQHVRTERHRFSSIHWYSAPSSDGPKEIVVKVPRDPRAPAQPAQPLADRPRLVPSLPIKHETQCEYDAAIQIQRHFVELGDNGLQCVRVLELLPNQLGVVAQAVPCPTLAHVLRGGNPRVDLETAFQRAGMWLKAFHEMPTSQTVATRNATCPQFREIIERYGSFLALRGGKRRWFDAIVPRVSQCAVDCLPADIPLGLNHGDYAPHNMFVSDDAAITAFDTLAHWRTAIYEDIARFLHLARREPGHTAQRETWFLEGYFQGEPIPHAAIKLYTIQVMLDEWCSAAFSPLRTTNLRAVAKYGRLLLRSREYPRRIEDLLSDVESAVARRELIDPSLCEARRVAACR